MKPPSPFPFPYCHPLSLQKRKEKKRKEKGKKRKGFENKSPQYSHVTPVNSVVQTQVMLIWVSENRDYRIYFSNIPQQKNDLNEESHITTDIRFPGENE